MNQTEVNRFNKRYDRYQKTLKPEQLEGYFSYLTKRFPEKIVSRMGITPLRAFRGRHQLFFAERTERGGHVVVIHDGLSLE